MVQRNLPTLATQAAPMAVLQAVIPQSYSNPGMSLAQIFAIIKAYRRQAAGIGFAVFLIMAIMGITKPKSYDAVATLQVNYEINDPLGGKEFPVGLIGSYVATQIELLSGPVVLNTVVDKLKRYDDKHFASLKEEEPVRRAAAEKVLEKNIVVEQGRLGSQLIFIKYTASSAMAAADIANGIAEVYTQREYRNPALNQNAEELAQYKAQLEELKQKVDAAQDQMAQFLKRTGLIAGDGGDIEMSALGNLESQLQDARNKRRQAEVLASANRNTSQALGSASVQALRTQLRTQEATMAQYRLTDGPKNPRVIELQGQIDATKKSLEDESKLDGGDSNIQLQSARELEAKLAKASEDQRARVIVERENKEEREKYRVNLELAQTAYRKALDSYEQITRDNSSKYNGINLISRATPPTQATGKRTRVSLIIGMIAGIFVGIGAAFLWGMIDRRVRCRDDIERDYGIPVIVEFGLIPN